MHLFDSIQGWRPVPTAAWRRRVGQRVVTAAVAHAFAVTMLTTTPNPLSVAPSRTAKRRVR
jgi:hypothetical protein